LVDLVLSYILVPASTVLAAVCAVGPYAEHVQASDKIIASYNLIFTLRLMLSFFQIFLNLPNTAAAFPICRKNKLVVAVVVVGAVLVSQAERQFKPCVNGDFSFLWESQKFDPPQNQNP